MIDMLWSREGLYGANGKKGFRKKAKTPTMTWVKILLEAAETRTFEKMQRSTFADSLS